jgi:hypothetical protein
MNPFEDVPSIETKVGSGRSSASSSWINQFKDTIAKKYKKPQTQTVSANTTAPTSKTIQRLRDIMTKPHQSGGDDTTTPPPSGVTNEATPVDIAQPSPPGASDANTSAITTTDTVVTTADMPSSTTEKSVADTDGKDTAETKEVEAIEVKEDKPTPSSEEKPSTETKSEVSTPARPEDLVKRMDQLTELLKKQMSSPAPYGALQLPSIAIPQMAIPQVSLPSMPTLSDAKGALEGAKSFLNVGTFSTDAMKETFLSGVKILSDTVERYTKWADTYRERQERLEKDAVSNPEYTKVRSDFENSKATAVPKRSINPIKYIPIDVKRNARIPPYAQLDLPAMKEVVRLQDEIYGPRGRPANVGIPAQLGPFQRDPYATNQEPPVTQIKPEDNSELSKTGTEQDTEEGFFNIKPQQFFNVSIGLIAAQIGVVGYYILKSM